ncbi:MAG: tetratricopeptide repeat protein [Anaerolineales bacterium]
MTTPLTLAIAAALAALLAACNIVDNLPFIATPTPTPTTTPTPTLTPTLTPTPTPAPTVPPTLRIESGEYALFIGDWDAAMREFNFALETDPGSDATAAALLGIGRTQHAQGKTFDALHTLRGLVKQYPNTPSTSGAYYFLAQVFTGLQRYEEAADAYQRYLDLRPGVIDGYVHEWRGDALLSAGEYLSAIEAYNAALIVPRLDAAEPIRIKIARSLSASGDYQSALTLYEDIYQNTTNDFFRAQVNLLRGEIHLLLGNRSWPTPTTGIRSRTTPFRTTPTCHW